MLIYLVIFLLENLAWIIDIRSLQVIVHYGFSSNFHVFVVAKRNTSQTKASEI